jgi:hypothetical protein
LRVEYSFENAKLKIRRPGSRDPEVYENVLLAQVCGKAFFLEIRQEEARKRAELIFAGKLAPDSPTRAWEISVTIRLLRGITPILAMDLPGWRNPRENPRREWLEALRQLEAELAREVRQFIQEGGVAEYLLPD